MEQPSVDDHLELLNNPLSAEFGVTTLAQMEHLIAHGLSSFKLVRRCCDCVIQQSVGQYIPQ